MKTIISSVSLLFNGKEIEFVCKNDYLGTILDPKMSLTSPYKNPLKNVSYKIFLLRKIRKCIHYHTALCIYRQAILPILEYSGFLLISIIMGQKNDLHVTQNDVLRFAKNVKIPVRVSRIKLHKDAKLFSLEQRREKHLFSLMYKLSRQRKARKVTNRNVFKTDVKIGKKKKK